jgi:hypothetical protein
MKCLTLTKIEAMKRLMLHRIASSLHRFIASVAQLCRYPVYTCPTALLIRAGPRGKGGGWGKGGVGSWLCLLHTISHKTLEKRHDDIYVLFK